MDNQRFVSAVLRIASQESNLITSFSCPYYVLMQLPIFGYQPVFLQPIKIPCLLILFTSVFEYL